MKTFKYVLPEFIFCQLSILFYNFIFDDELSSDGLIGMIFINILTFSICFIVAKIRARKIEKVYSVGLKFVSFLFIIIAINLIMN